MNKWIAILLCLQHLMPFLSSAQTLADLNAPQKIFYNAKIFTADKQQEFAEAIAISGDKIVAVGDLATVKRAMPEKVTLIDLQGACILPGLVDAHNHAMDGGIEMLSPQADDDIVSVMDLLRLVNQVKSEKTGMRGKFIVITNLDITTWTKIDSLNVLFNHPSFKNQPVWLIGSDAHTAWGNAALLKEADITKFYLNNLKPAERKYFGIYKDGTPTGFVADSGLERVERIVPEDTLHWKEGARKAMEYNNSFGITAWLDPAAGDISDGLNNEILRGYAFLAQNNWLTAHVAAVVVAAADADPTSQINRLKSIQEKYNANKNLEVIGFKIFADGVVEYPTQTAALSKPYLNTGSYGPLMFQPENFARFVTAADKENMLVHVHAIGDRAVTEALNGIEAARKANGNSGVPHSITHLQFVQPADFPRFSQLGVPAVFQLLWALGDPTTIEMVKPYVVPEIYQWQYPARSMLQAGAAICGSSDWNVSTANPFEAMYEAETRLGDDGVLDSAQCMPRISMFYAYTSNSGRALMMENKIGSITPGKFADLVLVDRDVLTVDAKSFKQTKVEWTMFEGKIVYHKE